MHHSLTVGNFTDFAQAASKPAIPVCRIDLANGAVSELPATQQQRARGGRAANAARFAHLGSALLTVASSRIVL